MSLSANKTRMPGAFLWTVDDPRIARITVLLALTLGFLVARWPMPVLALFVVAALAIGVASSREFALGAILVSSLTMLSVMSWFGLPARTGLLTKAVIGLFVLTVLLDLGPKNPLRVPSPLTVLVAVLAVSAAVTSGSVFVAFYALAVILAAPVAYVAILHSTITMQSLRRLALIVLVIGVAQVPLVLVQSRYLPHVDLMGGTFGDVGGTHIQSVVMGFAWTIAVALLFGRRRIWLLPVVLAIATVLLVSEAKAGFVFAVIGTISVGLAKAIANPKHGVPALVKYGTIAAVAVGTLFGAYLFLGALLPGGQQSASSWVTFLTNPAAVRNYLFSYDELGNAGRLEGTRLVLSQPSTTADLLIGRGIGLLTRAGLLGRAEVASSASFSGALDRATSMTKSLYEIGLLGTLLYCAVVGSAVGAVAKSWTSRTDELDVAVVAAAAGSAVVYVAAALYYAPWTTDAIAVPFWCLMGMAVKWGYLRQANRELEQGAEVSP